MSTRYVVRCDEYTSRAMSSPAVAERLLAMIAEDGHCTLDHEVVEVTA